MDIPLGRVKIERWRFLTFPKYVQGPFWANKINTHKFWFKGRLHFLKKFKVRGACQAPPGTHSKSKHPSPNRVKRMVIFQQIYGLSLSLDLGVMTILTVLRDCCCDQNKNVKGDAESVINMYEKPMCTSKRMSWIGSPWNFCEKKRAPFPTFHYFLSSDVSSHSHLLNSDSETYCNILNLHT